jgi:hypothetical protein
MFLSLLGVLLRLFMLAKIMMMRGLMMMMGGSVVISCGLMMMLTCRMLWGLCHGGVPPDRSWKTGRRLQLRYSAASFGGKPATGTS